jgi:hypothetical protein
MCPEFGLVGRHVDVDRAVALASLARKAEVEGIFDSLAMPSVLNRPSMEHLE